MLINVVIVPVALDAKKFGFHSFWMIEFSHCFNHPASGQTAKVIMTASTTKSSIKMIPL
jgi:hypothetical protein